MPIIDKFRDMGTVIMGKVESGCVREGDSFLIMPNKVVFLFLFYLSLIDMHMFTVTEIDIFRCYLQDPVKVVAIFVDEDRVKYAGPGENLRIRLSGVEEEDISSGFVLSSVGMYFWYLVNLNANFSCNFFHGSIRVGYIIGFMFLG